MDIIRSRLFPSLKQMPKDFINDASGVPRVVLSEPGGSSAEVTVTLLCL